jgi:two-component system, NarL family, nitrate/nitrite sensor histidine kinase NarX
MVNEVKQSLVIRSGMALAAVMLLAVLNMLVSYLVAESSENDGVSINLAGSLRMYSYRIATAVILLRDQQVESNEKEQLQIEIENFENRLHQPLLKGKIKASNQQELTQAYINVERNWQSLKRKLYSADIKTVLNDVRDHVHTIDDLVKRLELNTEGKFRLLRLVQGVFLLSSICIVTIAFYHIRLRVVGPLTAMVSMAARAREGDFSKRLNSEGEDELSLLAQAFNEMMDSLDAIYLSLENKVVEKTLHLENVQQGLRLLFDASQKLVSGGNFVDRLKETLQDLQRYLGVECVDVHMMHEINGAPFLISSNEQVSLITHESVAALSKVNDKQNKMTFPVTHGDEDYGYLVVSNAKSLRLDNERLKVVSALADTIASAVAYELRLDQRHHLALMEERAAIARELHDSLAQSLSYTKIQVSRFQILQQKSADSKELDSALDEIRTGIDAAYRQLREILTTFRLQIDSPGLQSSLEMTVAEFSEKGDIPIKLDYELGNFPLAPNEEVHILQIVREALSNVLRHSNARQAAVLLKLTSSTHVLVSIRDDGCGFGNEATGPNHYGKTIMSERASLLGGGVVYSDCRGGGARVTLTFEAKRVREQVPAVS